MKYQHCAVMKLYCMKYLYRGVAIVLYLLSAADWLPQYSINKSSGQYTSCRLVVIRSIVWGEIS